MMLFISAQAPFANPQAKGLLDIVLAASAFEVPLSFLLQGPGVLQLASQTGQIINNKNISNQLAALEMYGVEQIYVEKSAFDFYRLESKDIDLPIQLLEQEACIEFIAQHEKVIRL